MSQTMTAMLVLNTMISNNIKQINEYDEYFKSLDTEYDTGIGFLDYPKPRSIWSKFIKNLKRNYNSPIEVIEN